MLHVPKSGPNLSCIAPFCYQGFTYHSFSWVTTPFLPSVQILLILQYLSSNAIIPDSHFVSIWIHSNFWNTWFYCLVFYFSFLHNNFFLFQITLEGSWRQGLHKNYWHTMQHLWQGSTQYTQKVSQDDSGWQEIQMSVKLHLKYEKRYGQLVREGKTCNEYEWSWRAGSVINGKLLYKLDKARR